MPDDDLRRALDAAWMGSEKRNWIPGRLGKVNPDGSVSLETGRPGFVYVRVGPEGHLATSVARNAGAPLKAHLPVRMRIEDGVLVIHGADYNGGLESFGNGSGTGYNVDRHTHALGSGLEYAVEAMRLAPGRVQWLTDLTVTIFPFRYYYSSAWETWEGGTLDLTAYKPASGKWCWVLVGVDPATNAAIAAKSADQNGRAALTVGLIDAIAFAHYIPCAAVQLAESDTTVSDISRWVDAHGFYGGTRRSQATEDIRIKIVATPTRDDLEDYINVTGSKGVIVGGEITDGGSNTVNVAAGEGFLRASPGADDTARLYLIEWAAATGVSVPSNTTRYIGVNYGAGTPAVFVSTSADLDDEDEFLLGRVNNEAGTLHIVEIHDHVTSADHNIRHMTREVWGPIRAHQLGGLIVGETGTRNVTVSEGEIYFGTQEFAISALDTSGSDTFDIYYRASPSGWTKVASQTQWPNTQWDDGDGGLATLTNNRYGVLWWYIETDGDLCMLYGRGDYVGIANAEAEAPPATLPDRLTGHCILAARSIFQKSAATSIFYSAYTTTFTASAAGASTLDELTDVAITTPADNSVLAYDSGSALWIDQTAAEAGLSTVAALDDLSDVAITSAADGHILRRVSGTWANGFGNRPNLGPRTDVTIATGVVSIAGSPNSGFFNVRGEGAAADDLATINGGNAGDLIVLTGANEVITVKDATGNINCASDRTLNSGADVMMLLYDGSSWNEVVMTSNA